MRMSKLEQLIQEFCPDGVEYVSIGELIKRKTIKTITPTIKVKRNDYKEIGCTPIISQEAEYISGYCDLSDDNIFDNKYVCFGDHSEHLKYADFAFVQGADGLKIMNTDEKLLLTRYFYHTASSFYKRHNNYERHFKYFSDTVIPVPPIEVQSEIVRILDNFTELTAELTAELIARKKQYEYYRNSLLSYENTTEIQKVKLSEIAEIGTGNSNTNEGLEEGEYPFYVRSQTPLWKNEYEYDETAIITAGDGVGVGKVFHYVEGKYALHQRAYRIHIIDDSILPRYFYHYMRATFLPYIEKNMYHGSVASIRRPMLNDYPVPVPSLEEQRRIVNVLDRFDALCNDISNGLPAEIEARQKQYKYYRDELLTFKELN